MTVAAKVSRRRGDRHRAVSEMGWHVAARGRDVAAQVGVLGWFQRARHRRADGRRADRASAVVPLIVARLGELADLEASWQLQGVVQTGSNVTIIAAGPPEQPCCALIMVAETNAGAESLARRRCASTELCGDERLGDWRVLLPQVLDAGEIGATAYLVERRLPGAPLERALRQPGVRDAALRHSASAIQWLHRATAREATIGAELLDRLVGAPADVLTEVVARSRRPRAAPTALARLTDELRAGLDGVPTTLSWIHGDYGPGNILSGPDGRVSGIVDWEFARPDDLPARDVVTLLLTARMLVRRQELGRVVSDLVATPSWTSGEQQLLAATPGSEILAAFGTRAVVLLCWLHHVAGELGLRTRQSTSGLWIHTNVNSVLDAI
jgi:hypothetical protein